MLTVDSFAFAFSIHLLYTVALSSYPTQHPLLPTLCYLHIHTHTTRADSMREAARDIDKLIPQFFGSITTQVSQTCCRNLEPAHTIPRLYRRTNREVCASSGTLHYVNTLSESNYMHIGLIIR